MKRHDERLRASEGRQAPKRRRAKGAVNPAFPLCLALALAAACFAVGGTLAFLHEESNAVENSFTAGDITYTLNLKANASSANGDHKDEEVSMPSAPADQTSTALSAEFALDGTPALTGYTFSGWYYDAECTEAYPNVSGNAVTVKYGDSHDGKPSANKVGITLYAKWVPIAYTVEYDSNVDSSDTSVTQPTGITASSQHAYDVAQKLTVNGFERIGYTFIGWNTKADGTGVSYVNEESVTNLTSAEGGTVTLYAQWGVKTYAIHYNANGGEGEMPDQMIEWDKLTELSANKFTRTDGDCKFAGWATSSDGEVKYLDSQPVVNLLESGTLNLYAVWLQNSYTVTFDYNLGWGTPPTKEVLYGEQYGVLPPYLWNEEEKLFIGWYTEPNGGERVYPETIVALKKDHTLYAHWEDSPVNAVIQDLVVKNSADDNNDGVADEISLVFVCSSSYEKYNIPLKNLVPGQTYTLTYTTSSNASFGDYIKGYKNARYGSYILESATKDEGNINDAVATDIIATWNNRIEADGTNDGSQEAINDEWLNGPWTRTITFTATQETMYWAWEFGLIEDNVKYDYNIYDISLEPVAPTIEFANKQVIKGSSSAAEIVSQANGAYSSTFTFDGEAGCETVYWPITGLTAGTTYTITFDHEFSGLLIHDTKSNPAPTYEYGCGIMNATPTKTGDKMSSLGTWASSTFVKTTADGATKSVTLTFTATGDTAYWVWNMANCSDSTNTTTKVTVTSFSAKHTGGGSITYYDASSQTALSLASEASEADRAIELVWDGIDDTYLDAWYPVDEQTPVAGDDYELAFEPMEGYVMAEMIAVSVDDVIYQVYTGATSASSGVPSFDEERNVLVIPGELLTEGTATVGITASAVPADEEVAA